ncbi:hypothetical protein [Streptomyces sp. NPDC095613]|uniref:hypothetical protein n=1 Tax=Streptomyces sp. NPDC095613 TaxID=3155540 RepID=UPI0033298BD3
MADLPPVVIADLLGIHPKTAERWATLAGGNWCGYLAVRRAAPHGVGGIVRVLFRVLRIKLRQHRRKWRRRPG